MSRKEKPMRWVFKAISLYMAEEYCDRRPHRNLIIRQEYGYYVVYDLL